VRKKVLDLYINAGVDYGKQGNHQKAAKTFQAGISYAEDFLTAGETSSGAREQVLWLYNNAGWNYYNQSNHQKAAETWQAGISHAQDFLTAGETSSGMRKQVLELYEYQLLSYYNSHQINKLILLLPINGIWSHTALAQVEPDRQQKMLENWQRKLEISLKFPSFTAAFETFSIP
jgi:tetratricopeptide (TPR) repeat protein